MGFVQVAAPKVSPSLEPLLVPVGRLHEDPRNARLHSERNVEAVRRSLELFGQVKPIVARRDGTVIAGNATLRAALALGWDRIAVAWWEGEDEMEAAAYGIADNRTAELAR